MNTDTDGDTILISLKEKVRPVQSYFHPDPLCTPNVTAALQLGRT